MDSKINTTKVTDGWLRDNTWGKNITWRFELLEPDRWIFFQENNFAPVALWTCKTKNQK
jgi:hypothetical protein